MNSHDEDLFGPILQTVEQLAPEAPILTVEADSKSRPVRVFAGAFAGVLVLGAVGLAIMNSSRTTPLPLDRFQSPIVSTTVMPSSEESPTTTLAATAAGEALLAAMEIVMTDATAINDRLFQAGYSSETPRFDTTTLGTEVPFDPIPPGEMDDVVSRMWKPPLSPEGNEQLIIWTPVYIGHLNGHNVAVRVVRDRDPQGVATEYVCSETFGISGGSVACDDFHTDDGRGYGASQRLDDNVPGPHPWPYVLLSGLGRDVAVVAMNTPDGSVVWQRPTGGFVMFDTRILNGRPPVVTLIDRDGVVLSSQTFDGYVAVVPEN